MSSYFLRKMPAFDGVAAGATATLRAPVGLTFHRMILKAGGTPVANSQVTAHIPEIRTIVNGDIQQRFSASELVAVNKWDKVEDIVPAAGTAAATSYLNLMFDRPTLKTRRATEFTAVGTGLAFSDPPDPTPIATFS